MEEVLQLLENDSFGKKNFEGSFKIDKEMKSHRNIDFLPTTLKEVKALGWEQLDVILISGDAYVDHPSFGVAVIGRLLSNYGYKAYIVPQPNWQDDCAILKIGSS